MSTFHHLRDELINARTKYPDSTERARTNGVIQEFGEALQAIAKWQLDPRPQILALARLELLQAAAMAIRFIEEVQ